VILEITAVGIVILSMVLVEIKDLLHAAITLAAADMLLALAFYMLGAPDIAITQAAVVAGLSTLILVISINKTHRQEGVEE
jgi:multicomponent Na+:H+ antiporter subunit B